MWFGVCPLLCCFYKYHKNDRGWGTQSSNNQVIITVFFTGVVGGPNYDITGGGVDFQCLPPNPELNNYNPSATDVSWIRSVEYESQNYGLFADDIDNKHAVCSQCFTGQLFSGCEASWLCCGFVNKSLSFEIPSQIVTALMSGMDSPSTGSERCQPVNHLAYFTTETHHHERKHK